MSRLKTFLIYLLLVIGLFVVSNVLIFLGLNSNYSNIVNIDGNSDGIEIYKAEATSANVRIKGKIISIDEVQDKYLKLELVSDVGTNVGVKYYPIADIKKENKDGEFKIYFDATRVQKYKLSIVDEK